MPCLYTYQHPDGRIIDICQNMNDNHDYWLDEDGVKWQRVFTIPNASIDSISNLNPNNSKEFVRKTGKIKGKLKDIYQLSAELSEKRAQKDGVDHVKLKSWDNYEKNRVKGTVHPDRKKEQLKEFSKKNKHFDINV